MTISAYGHMVHEYYVARFRAAAAARLARLARVKTQAQALALREDTRKRLHKVFGPWPVRTPLHPVVTGRVQRRGYTIESVHFQSRPGYYVTANLYIPKGAGPFPAVLGCCGHTDNGKAGGSYQRFSHTLAEHGYAVLLWDPVAQGERGQFVGVVDAPRPLGCVRQHLLAGSQLSVVGESFASWHVWDGIRALDYLLSRPEVDSTRVGLTGNSGGGTLSTFLNALDDRFTMTASSCFVTTFLCDIESELPSDNEQTPTGIVAMGLDLADFFIAQAPRPTILIGQYNDYFDERGLRQTYEEVRRVYKLLGNQSRVQLHMGPGEHGYQKDGRQAMYRFFNQTLGLGESDREPTRPVEEDITLQVTANGQVAGLPGHKSIADFARGAAEALAKRRGKPQGDALTHALVKVLGLPGRGVKSREQSVCHYRVLRPLELKLTHPDAKPGYDVAFPFALETEPGIQALLFEWERRTKTGPRHRAQPDPAPDATLYLPHQSSEDDVLGQETLVRPEILWTLDPRGMGRSTPVTCLAHKPALDLIGAEFFYSVEALMLGESYLGRRVYDTLAALDLLSARGAKRIHLVGRGMGSVIATFAGCLHAAVSRVTLRHALRSFDELARSPVAVWPMSCIPWGVLKSFDLPDCHRMLKAKRLKIVEPWGAGMNPLKVVTK